MAALVVSTTLTVAACTSSGTTDPAAQREAFDARYAKGGKSTPGLNVQFADSANVAADGSPPFWSLTGIRGDGRLKSGVAATSSPSNEYESKYCGVEAYGGSEGLSASGNLNIDSDISWTASMQSVCGSKRQFHFHLGGVTEPPTLLGPHTLSEMGIISVGQTVAREVRFGVQMTNCAGIRFSNAYPPSVNARVTRLPNIALSGGSVVKQWRIESQGSHRGSCVVQGKKDFVATGVSHYLPFSMTVTEVPATTAVYP